MYFRTNSNTDHSILHRPLPAHKQLSYCLFVQLSCAFVDACTLHVDPWTETSFWVDTGQDATIRAWPGLANAGRYYTLWTAQHSIAPYNNYKYLLSSKKYKTEFLQNKATASLHQYHNKYSSVFILYCQIIATILEPPCCGWQSHSPTDTRAETLQPEAGTGGRG